MNRPSALITVGALLAGFAAGFWSMGKWCASGSRAGLAASATGAPAHQSGTAVPHAAESVKIPNDFETEMVRQMSWERKLLLTPMEQFPALFEDGVRNARSGEGLQRLLQMWADRDPAGFTAWGKAQPQYRNLEFVSGSIGIGDLVMKTTIRHDPDEAWILAGRMPGLPDMHRWSILTSLVERDPAAAVAFLGKHRDVFSASQQAYGFWFIMDPMKILPLLDQFSAGPAKNDLVKESARYYLENPGQEAAAEAWFAKLPPDLREQAASKAREPAFHPLEPAHRETYLRIWKAEPVSGEIKGGE